MFEVVPSCFSFCESWKPVFPVCNDDEPRRAFIDMHNIALFSASALDAALAFQQQFVVPTAWKTEVKEESSSSEDEEDEEEEEQEEDASGGEEEVEEEKLAHLHQNLTAKHRFYLHMNIYGLFLPVFCPQEEVEPFPEERENFLQQLYKFMEDRGEEKTRASLQQRTVWKGCRQSASAVYLHLSLHVMSLGKRVLFLQFILPAYQQFFFN